MNETKILHFIYLALGILNIVSISIGAGISDTKKCLHVFLDVNIGDWLLVSGIVGLIFIIIRACMSVLFTAATDGDYAKGGDDVYGQPYLTQIIVAVFFLVYAAWLFIWFIFGAVVYDYSDDYCSNHIGDALAFALSKIIIEFIIMCVFCCLAPLNCFRSIQD